jgi:anti-sigma B factor antagonist
MEILTIETSGVAVVSVTGSIDALTSEPVAKALSGKKQVVLDLGGVEFMSSAGLRMILGALKESRSSGGDLRIAAAQPGVEKVLKISGFTSILKTYSDVKTAVESFAA